MEEGTHYEDAAPMNLQRSLHYRREGGIDQEKGWRWFVHPGFEGLKVIRDGKDGDRERVTVSRSHGDKPIGE